ncbi:prefoldin subunit 1-like [Anneissia japonica]|uniref:prefoldin subunit 1-like n=1 Tax=Anneissia japonica TaxID=1529436 RepID=UPI001425957E|nr:prefoldin subunit 1-like [Anneissia japonica]
MNVDLELKKAFQEQQVKMVETTQQVRVADTQIEFQKRSQQHAKLTSTEIGKYPQETRVYEGVGRMFILQDIPTIQNLLSERVKKCETKVKDLESKKTYLERTLKESEDNLREMVASKQAILK